MKHLTYTSAQSIIAALYRDLGSDLINESDIIEWLGMALNHIGSIEYTQLATAFIEVQDYKCVLPDGCVDLLQILKRNTSLPENIKQVLNECSCLNFENKQEKQNNTQENERLDSCGYPVVLDCNGQPIEDYDLAYYRPYFDYMYWYFDTNKKKYNDWVLLKQAQHSFFPAVKNKPKLGLHNNIKAEEYKVIDDVLQFSFEKGYVAISYYKRIYDKDGYPLIPDEVSVIQAITSFCTYKIFQKAWYQGREGMRDKWEIAYNEWNWYCRQAKSKAKSLNAEQLEQLSNYMTTLLPRDNYWSSLRKSYGIPEDVSYIKNTAYDTRKYK